MEACRHGSRGPLFLRRRFEALQASGSKQSNPFKSQAVGSRQAGRKVWVFGACGCMSEARSGLDLRRGACPPTTHIPQTPTFLRRGQEREKRAARSSSLLSIEARRAS